MFYGCRVDAEHPPYSVDEPSALLVWEIWEQSQVLFPRKA